MLFQILLIFFFQFGNSPWNCYRRNYEVSRQKRKDIIMGTILCKFDHSCYCIMATKLFL